MGSLSLEGCCFLSWLGYKSVGLVDPMNVSILRCHFMHHDVSICDGFPTINPSVIENNFKLRLLGTHLNLPTLAE